MPLKLMYITNNPEVAKIAEESGVDRIFVDMEFIGKDTRQGGLDTVKNHHTIEDIRTLRKVINKSELMVRVNPIHEQSSDYMSSEKEINKTIEAGANIIMLPYFKTVDEVRKFIKYVDRRTKTYLLIETPQAIDSLDEILELDGIDEIHIGLNDLHLELHLDFMFELLANGTVENICNKIKATDIPYGFGGIARIGEGTLPSEIIIAEHYRLGSTRAILSRSFCNTQNITNLDEIKARFKDGVKEIREFEASIEKEDTEFYIKNQQLLKDKVAIIVQDMKIKESK